MSENFGERMARAMRQKRSVAVIGLDPVREQLPPELAAAAAGGPEAAGRALGEFCLGIIGAVAELVPAVKPNIAFFEALGEPGLRAYNETCRAARAAGLLVIGDLKRGDIGSTAAAYAKGHFAPDGAGFGPHDALTINPYLGSDSLAPFIKAARAVGGGLFVLVKTSNPSSSELQDLVLRDGGTVAEAAARLVARLGATEAEFSDVGAVVGATHPQELANYRALMPQAPLLVPGYGAQGGTAFDVVGAFRGDGLGALVNASRSVIYAWSQAGAPADWRQAARQAAERMNADLNQALAAAGKKR